MPHFTPNKLRHVALDMTKPVCNEVLRPLFGGGSTATAIRQARAVVAECGAGNCSGATLRLARMGKPSKKRQHIEDIGGHAERDLRNACRRELKFKVDITYITIPIIDVKALRGQRKSKKSKRRGKKELPTKLVKWPVCAA